MLTKTAQPHQAHPNLLPVMVILLRDPENREVVCRDLENAAMSTKPERWQRLVCREVMQNLCLLLSTATTDHGRYIAVLRIMAALFLRARGEGVPRHSEAQDWFKEFHGSFTLNRLSDHSNSTIRDLVDFVKTLAE